MLKNKILLVIIISLVVVAIVSRTRAQEITFKGFGWYGYLADDELNGESIQKIKELNGNSVNINVYYEYDLENESFILLSNLTKIEEKIDLAHSNRLKVFLSPFANIAGGNYTGGAIKNQEKFLSNAKNISIELAKLAEKKNVEIYAVWNEMGLAISKIPNSTNKTNDWLQETKEEIRKLYNGILTTKEGVQLDLYKNYNFSTFDCIGVTFYPFTTSFAQHPGTGQTLAGVENLTEYENIVNEHYQNLIALKKKFKSKCIIVGEIGIDVVGGKFIGDDEDSNRIRAIAYEIVLKNGKDKIDGFFFSKFEYKSGESKELDEIFRNYFK